MQNELGPCAQFSVYHLMDLKEGEERLRLGDDSVGLFSQEVVVLHAPESAAPIVSQDLIGEANKKATNGAAHTNGTSAPLIVRSDPKTLGEISKLLRSKNAGPYEITLDVMFDSEAEYKLVKESNMLTKPAMAKLFDIQEDDILYNDYFDQALAFKVTIPRLRNGKPTASGGYMENDVHGSQLYIGLMNLPLPEDLVQRWNKLQQQ